MLAFIRYMELNFAFGLLDCARYNEDFVIPVFSSNSLLIGRPFRRANAVLQNTVTERNVTSMKLW